MKKMSARKKKRQAEGLRPEYQFDYSKSRSNRFATQMAEGSVAVVLEPDVAAVFKSSEAVNAFLRSVISATSGTKRKPT